MSFGFCPHCGTQRTGAGKFCGSCGTSYPDLPKCPTCGQQLPPGATANPVGASTVAAARVVTAATAGQMSSDPRLVYGDGFKSGDCVNCGSEMESGALSCGTCGFQAGS